MPRHGGRAISTEDRVTYEKRTRALEQAARNAGGISGLILLGSAAVPERRDEWSDHDFFVIARPGTVEQVRKARSRLPDPEPLVLLVRESATGVSALCDNGLLFEFAAATAAELTPAPDTLPDPTASGDPRAEAH